MIWRYDYHVIQFPWTTEAFPSLPFLHWPVQGSKNVLPGSQAEICRPTDNWSFALRGIHYRRWCIAIIRCNAKLDLWEGAAVRNMVTGNHTLDCYLLWAINDYCWNFCTMQSCIYEVLTYHIYETVHHFHISVVSMPKYAHVGVGIKFSHA